MSLETIIEFRVVYRGTNPPDKIDLEDILNDGEFDDGGTMIVEEVKKQTYEVCPRCKGKGVSKKI